MRLKARVDSNQQELVKVFREAGALVWHTHQLGKGTPDLIISVDSLMKWIEVKDGTRSKSQQRLTPDEEKFHSDWNSCVEIVSSKKEALKVVAKLQKQSKQLFQNNKRQYRRPS